MTRAIIAIFAHPDDEAFGPSGTLLKLREEGYDIHLILLTDGEAGTNPDNEADLGAVRLHEWQDSARILGARSTHPLHYPDGALETIAPDELDENVRNIIDKIIATYDDVPELSFMTFEPNGLTSHRDHIAASELTTRMTQQFQTKAIWYFCLDSTQAPLDDTAYYEPRARADEYITRRVDISLYQDKKYHMIDAHVSQRTDGAAMKKLGATTECFHVDTL